MKITKEETQTRYQYKRSVDREVSTFMDGIIDGPDTDTVDDDIRKFRDHVTTKTSKDTDIQIKQFLRGMRSAPWATIRGGGKTVHIAIDSEWVFNAITGKNDILCYSYSIRIGNKKFSGVKATKMAKLIKDCRDKGLSKDDEMEHRQRLSEKGYKLNFDKFIQELLIKAKARGFIDDYPKYTFIYAHFLRADIASFEEFWKIGSKNKNYGSSLTAVQGSVTSGRGTYGIKIDSIGRSKYRLENTKFYTTSNNTFETKLRFIDTLLLSSKASLDDLGVLCGIPKMTLPDNMIEHMDELYCKDRSLFNRYAERDAHIALEYGLKMQKFALVDMFEDVGLELNQLPSTLGNFGVSLFKHTCGSTQNMHGSLGYEMRKNNYYHAPSNSVRNSTDITKTVSREYTDALAVNCFYGGCNFGAYFGPTVMGDYYDFDLSGAYTTALVDVLEVDYANTFESKDIEDYLGHTMGFAYVRFKHPEGTKWPLLPCRTALRGIYYPMEGETYVTAPELQVAYDAGVEVEILHGQIIPWKQGSTSMFKGFTQIIRKQRAKYKKAGNELYDQLWKLIGNTLYGKTGQGLREKSGFVRATMLEVILNLPEGTELISATTDGFIIGETEDKLDLSGVLARRFQSICDEVSGENMMQLKHHAKQIVSMKTRGQLTSEMGDTKAICAKAGVKPPKGVDENEWMLALFLDRQPKQKIKRKHLASARDMWLKEMDLVAIHTEQTLNLEYDFKRCPVNPRMVEVRHPVTNEQVEHLSFDTVPWKTLDGGLTARTFFDEWRVNNCLKNMDDWDNWMDFYKVRCYLKGTGLKYLEDGSMGIFKMQMLRAITQGKWGLPETPKRAPRGYYDKLAAKFEVAGIEGVSRQDFANSKARKLQESILPITPRIVPLLAWFVGEYPTADLALIFHPKQIGEAIKMLEEYKQNSTDKLVAQYR